MGQSSFAKPAFLHNHIKSILAFYHPNVDDPHGGFYQNFSDDGSVFDKQTRHLVSSTRFVFNYARAYIAYGNPEDLERVKSGVQFLQQKHLNPITGGYYWLLSVDGENVEVLDDTNHCYGLAFVLLAYSWAYRAGLQEAKAHIEKTWQMLETHFWDQAHGLYRDEFNADFSECAPYRGQNANMHSCEALIAAYEATQEDKYLSRAMTVARQVTNTLASKASGRIWEHYDNQWNVDWDYNKGDPKNLFRPWGFQPGHHTEWSKLLLLLHQYTQESWLVEKAQSLFDNVLPLAWDDEHGGICYGFAPDHSICDGEKYFWVQAESFACAARLALVTGEGQYWQWYDKIWQYAWDNFVDHDHGAWFRILSQDNQKLETTKSPVGKTDYHTMGACYDVLDAFSKYSANSQTEG